MNIELAYGTFGILAGYFFGATLVLLVEVAADWRLLLEII
jgi:hypothetical protein